jgi:sigma-B regulation protein RsbU (phosphoserine phosphatase)
MLSDSLTQALGGSSLVKLALILVFGLSCLLIRRKETEGVFTRLAFVALFLVLRDLLFFVFPLADIYRVSDLLLFILLAYVNLPGKRGLAFWSSLIVQAVAALLIVFKDLLELAPGFPSEVLRLLSLVSVVAIALSPGVEESETSPGRLLLGRTRLPLAIASLLYILAGAVLGAGSAPFQALAVPLFYGFFIWLGSAYSGIVERQLVKAVDHYEESVDSLYELLLPSETAKVGSIAMEDALENMVRVVAERTGADSSAILLVEEFEEVLSLRSTHGNFVPPIKLPESLPRSADRIQAYLRHARFKLGEGLLGEVTGTGKPIYIADAALDARVPRNGDEDWLVIASLIAVPLIVRDRVIGVLALEKAAGEPFSEADFDRAKLLSSFGSIAIANSFSFLEAAEKGDIEREASLAEGIQKTLLPKKLPVVGNYSFGATTRTARGVCSDYYDVIQTRSDRVVLAVGDIAGKGIAAGIIMVMVSSILHLIINSLKDTATLMSWVNRGITSQMDLDHFATLGLVTVDTTTGLLEFSNASHQPLLIYRREGDAVETVDMKSIPIGVEKSTVYAAKGIRLHAGDVLLMHTDGIVEAMNEQGKQFGRKNLAAALHRAHDLPAKELVEAILDEVQDFSGKTRQHDDETVLVMKAKL